jgi:RecA/RadA recombinase
MGRKPKDQVEPEAISGPSSKSLLSSFLKDNKDEHYNFEEEVSYKVSTGSLNLDIATSGGLSPGLHRFIGMNEGGKTSEALEVMKNFLKTVPKSRGILIKAEGRLSKEIKDRSGIQFVSSPDDWNDGNCFVFESNIFETVSELIKELIQNNPEENRYMFILDSVDGLITRGDSEKSLSEATKVAGGAVISSTLMKKISLALGKRGHMAIFISQVRSEIKLDPYAANKDIRQTTATGGNALLHFANWILEFEPRFNKDLILEKPNERYDSVKNKIIGHNVKIVVKKSTNESTNSKIQYPIKYGRKDGSSVWREYEVIDQIVAWEFATAKGAWVTFSDEIIEELKKVNLELKKQHQGIDNLRAYLEENKPIVDYFYNKFINTLAS